MVDMPPIRPLPKGLYRHVAAGDAPVPLPRQEPTGKAVVSLFQTLPAMDVGKVAAIKAAIAEGSLTISPVRIAQAILADRSKGWT